MLKLWRERDAKLWRVIVDIGETLPVWNQTHPTCASSLTIDNCDDANIRWSAPVLNV
jgi:hypothetical protein